MTHSGCHREDPLTAPRNVLFLAPCVGIHRTLPDTSDAFFFDATLFHVSVTAEHDNPEAMRSLTEGRVRQLVTDQRIRWQNVLSADGRHNHYTAVVDGYTLHVNVESMIQSVVPDYSALYEPLLWDIGGVPFL